MSLARAIGASLASSLGYLLSGRRRGGSTGGGGGLPANTYLQPDGVSTYLQPDGTSYYIQP